MIVGATCVPFNMRYPQGITLLIEVKNQEACMLSAITQKERKKFPPIVSVLGRIT